MKTGRSLTELAAEIERQATTKRDFIAPTDKINVVPVRAGDSVGGGIAANNGVALELPEKGAFSVNQIALNQIAEHTGIPTRYVEKCRSEAPELLANNIETWFKRFPAPRMLRTLDGKNRAFLSDKFSPLDNWDFANAAFPMLLQRKLTIQSAEITETRLYIKAVDEKLYRDVPVGYKMGDGSHKIFETFAPAIILSNSEVGFGRLVVETGIYTQACTNLALFAKGGFKRTHVGARHRLTEGLDVEDLDAIMSDATKRKTMEALWLQVRDVVGSAFDEKMVTKRVEAMEVAAGRQITKPVDKVIEIVAEKFSLNDGERGSILQHLAAGGMLNQYGLSAAITRASQDVESYDRATELEYLGGRVVELPRTEWAVLAEAA